MLCSVPSKGAHFENIALGEIMKTQSKVFKTLIGVGGVVCLIGCAGTAMKTDTMPTSATDIVVSDGAVPITTTSEKARELFLKARTEFENVLFPKANQLAAAALVEDPNFALAYLYLGRSSTSPEDVASNIKKAMTLRDNVSVGERMIIEAEAAFFIDNDIGRATEIIKSLTELYPHDVRVFSRLGVSYYFAQNYEAALDVFNTAMTIDANYAPVYNMLGYTAWRLGDLTRAESAFMNYIVLMPDHPNPYDSVAEFYMKTGRFDDAISHFEQAVVLGGDNLVNSQRSVGICYAYLGRFDEANTAIGKAVVMATTPNDVAANHTATGRVHLVAGNYTDAIAAFDMALTTANDGNLAAGSASFQIQKGWICIDSGDLEGAAMCIKLANAAMDDERILAVNRSNYHLQSMLLTTLLNIGQGDIDMAVSQAEAIKTDVATTTNPNNMADYYYPAVGAIHMAKGEFADAAVAFEQANMNNPRNIYLLGQAEVGAGNTDHAVELFTKAANWNEDGLQYSLIRSKALAALN